MPAQISSSSVHSHSTDSNPRTRETHSRDAQAHANAKSDTVQLPRAASYTYFPKVSDSIFEENKVVGLQGTISEKELAESSTTGDGDSTSSSTGAEAEATQPLEMSRRPSLSTRKSSTRSTVAKFLGRTKASEDLDQRASRKSLESEKSKSPAKTLTKLRRKSIISSSSRDASPVKSASRSPVRRNTDASLEDASNEQASEAGIPKKVTEEQRSRTWSFGAGRRISMMGGVKEKEAVDTDVPQQDDSTTARRRKMRRSIARPSSVLVRGSTLEELSVLKSTDDEPMSDIPVVPSLPKSFSTDRLPSLQHKESKDHLPQRVPSIPRQRSPDKVKGRGEVQRKKDELWNVFRTLDGDFQKFQSKSIALKTNVVRATLTPFLRAYGAHPSNQKLRAEDLDRRTNILNKWWTGLLEMLAGRNNQSISGTDRPAILEAIVGIMERPEWRLRPSPFSPTNNTGTMTTSLQSRSTTSLSSASSDFLAESVQHNVRNIFTQNLLAQMSFVVDKMSLRNAPASLVSFCGKTAAYAFFFCPGIADILVRLWEPSPDVMKRVMEENGVSRLDKLSEASKVILASFPPNLLSLRVVSLRQISQELRKPHQPQLGAANLDWQGPWVKRWEGTESDLFYVFVKHYHVLANDFLPSDTSRAERLCAPGLLMVHTQMLKNLESTIHRHAKAMAPEDTSRGVSAITFDDVLGGDPDATAAPLPMAPTNATRLMAENRLIMLLRDVVSERTPSVANTRHMFAESFCQILKACARRVSLYNHNASYTLCDFLEETVGILVRYEQSSKQDILDWPFWLSVCRKMAESQNTATEIRLYAFLFSVWGAITVDPDRKTDTCLDFLLEDTFFESRFNHWCPMVRAYYMRLLCWRVARFDGEAVDGDIVILDRLLECLRLVWSHFLYFKNEAETNQSLPPNSVPCPPAPGRRLLIIRTDAPVHSSAGSFISFDGIVSPAVQSPPIKRDSVLGTVQESNDRPASALSNASSDYGQSSEDTGKKRWNLFKNFMNPMSPRSKSRSPGPKEESPSPQKSGSSTPKATLQPASILEIPPIPTHRSFCFRFSLEWYDKRHPPITNMRLYPPRLPMPAQRFLQSNGKLLPRVQGEKPEEYAATSTKYAGRALAEWTLVVNECQNFFDRRTAEGVPANKWVETPTLSVETFKRPG